MQDKAGVDQKISDAGLLALVSKAQEEIEAMPVILRTAFKIAGND